MPRQSAPRALQERSRKTEERLLQAAEQVLEKRGLEGASVPEIARRSGVSAASIYRRFGDKDALLHAVFERFFERSIRSNEATLDPAQWPCRTLAESVRTLIAGMISAYSEKRGLLRSVIAYGDQHPSAAFRRRTLDLRKRSVTAIEQILLLHEREIKHPEPKRAVHFAMQLITLALKERVLPGSGKERGATLSDEELQMELTRVLLGYLRSPALDPAT